MQAKADLSLVKTPKTGTVAAGGTFTWNLAVHNDGPSDAAAPITVTDTLPGYQSYLSAERRLGLHRHAARRHRRDRPPDGHLHAEPGAGRRRGRTGAAPAGPGRRQRAGRYGETNTATATLADARAPTAATAPPSRVTRTAQC